jgi:hypothetical protein
VTDVTVCTAAAYAPGVGRACYRWKQALARIVERSHPDCQKPIQPDAGSASAARTSAPVDRATVRPPGYMDKSVQIARTRPTHLHHACSARPDLHTVCRSFPKISSALSAKVCGGSRSAKKPRLPLDMQSGVYQRRRRLHHCACGFTATACSIADRTCAVASSARSRVA